MLPEKKTKNHAELGAIFQACDTGPDVICISTWFRQLKDGSEWLMFIQPSAVVDLTEERLRTSISKMLKNRLYIYSHVSITINV